MKLSILAGPVTRVSFDCALSLQFGDTELRIESFFELRFPDGYTGRLDAEHPEGAAGKLVALRGVNLESGSTEGGILYLLFANDAKLTVFPDASYEAWSISKSTGIAVVCLPGGEIATWEDG